MNAHPEIGAWSPGYQVKKARQVQRSIPGFAKDAATLHRTLLADYMVRYRVCELAWLSGWSSKEIGEALSLTPAHVRQILRRVRRKFEQV